MAIPGVATSHHTQQITAGKPVPTLRLPADPLWVTAIGCHFNSSLNDLHFFNWLIDQGVNVWMFSPAEAEESELSLGQFLVNATVNGDIAREALFIIEQLGKIDAGTAAWLQQRQAQKRPINPIDHAQGYQYSLHPKLLEQQLSHSLARLQLYTLDWVVLEDPPLLHRVIQGEAADVLFTAMLKMEKLAREELLRSYGLALPYSAISDNTLWLERLLQVHESMCLKLNLSPEESAFRGLLFTHLHDLHGLTQERVSLWGKTETLPNALQRLNWWAFSLASTENVSTLFTPSLPIYPFPVLVSSQHFTIWRSSGSTLPNPTDIKT